MQKAHLSFSADEETSALREQRNELKLELDASRYRIARLEEEVYRGERQTILEFLDQQQGATFAEIVQHIVDEAPARVAEIVEEMEADRITVRDGKYRLQDGEIDADE